MIERSCIMSTLNDDYIFGGLFAALGVFAIIFLTFFVILFVLYIVGRWKLFKKAGKNGWEAIIPFYNDWVYVEIAGLNYWWFFLVIATTIANIIDVDYLSSIASIASLVGLFFCNYNISMKLHKDVAFAILMTIFPFIMMPIIGLSDNYKWDDSVVVSSNGPIADNKASTVNNNSNQESSKDDVKYCSYCGNKMNKDDKFCNSCGKEV